MRIQYRQVEDLGDVVTWLTELSAKAVLFDVEPLIASWDTDQEVLRQGVEDTLRQVLPLKELEVVGFVTNSFRRLDRSDITNDDDEIRIFYMYRAAKPFLTRRHRDLPRPAVVVGDQVATDGLLAWRLDFAFAHLQQPTGRRPRGPRLMHQLGRPLTRWLFYPS